MPAPAISNLNFFRDSVRRSGLVYDAPWYQPSKLPIVAIAHLAPQTRACNVDPMRIFSCYSVAWCQPPNLYVLGLAYIFLSHRIWYT
jgi:hypothetical protein